jgi:hypothetical protein
MPASGNRQSSIQSPILNPITNPQSNHQILNPITNPQSYIAVVSLQSAISNLDLTALAVRVLIYFVL